MKLLTLLSLGLFFSACMQTPPLPEDHIYNKQGDNSPYAIKKPVDPKKDTKKKEKK